MVMVHALMVAGPGLEPNERDSGLGSWPRRSGRDCRPLAAGEGWCVLKDLVGSVDAAKVWFDHISDIFITKLDFVQCHIDRCCFRLVEADSVCIILLYVDDMLMMGNRGLCHRVKTTLKTLVPITDSGTNYLGMEIDHDAEAGRVRVTQRGYSEKILELSLIHI